MSSLCAFFNIPQHYDSCEEELLYEKQLIFDTYNILTDYNTGYKKKIRVFKDLLDILDMFGGNTKKLLILIIFKCSQTSFMVECTEQNSKFREVLHKKYDTCLELYQNKDEIFANALRDIQLTV